MDNTSFDYTIEDNASTMRYKEIPRHGGAARVGFFWGLFFVTTAVLFGALAYALDPFTPQHMNNLAWAVAGGAAAAGVILVYRMYRHDRLQVTRVWYWAPLEEEDDPLPPVPTMPRETISIAGSQGRITSFVVSDRVQFVRLLSDALANRTADKDGVSLGKNDAAKYGIGGTEWRSFFVKFVQNGWIEERDNRKPIITGMGATQFERWMAHYGRPSVGDSDPDNFSQLRPLRENGR